MKYRKLGKNGPQVSALGLGCMVMSSHYGLADEKDSIALIREAYHQGITFFDTADMYGKGENEQIVGKGIKPFRDQIILATKCALEYVPEGLKINNDPAYIKTACEKSLKRLEIDKIDLYYLHRYNPQVPLVESMQAMLELVQEGKIDYVGLSEASPEIIERAHAILKEKLIAVQSEYSLMNHEAAELVLPACRKFGIAFVAFSPLTRGLLSGKIKDREKIVAGGEADFRGSLPQFREGALQQNLRFVEALQAFAQHKGCTVAQLALAWLLAQGEDIIPIPGTKRLEYLKENLGSLDVVLTKEDMQSLRRIIKEHPIQGQRLPESMDKFNWK